MVKIRKCNKDDYPLLVEIWERSVRASHDFLAEVDIQEIKNKLASVYFPKVELFCCEDNNAVTGFIGMYGKMIEMLFIDSVCRGKGYGTILIEKAIKDGATHVDVNEQNPSALKFYMTKGFRIDGRSETDEAGRPFAILHLSLQE